MYLKETGDGPFVTLISFFRVVTSPHARATPRHAAGSARRRQESGEPNVCLTDNEPLADYVKRGFVSHFGAFKGVKSLSNVQMKPAWDFMAEATAALRTPNGQERDRQVSLTWEQLSAPFMVEFMKEQSATGAHEMFSLFPRSLRGPGNHQRQECRRQAFPRDWPDARARRVPRLFRNLD